jgi:hypothetical protein
MKKLLVISLCLGTASLVLALDDIFPAETGDPKGAAGPVEAPLRFGSSSDSSMPFGSRAPSESAVDSFEDFLNDTSSKGSRKVEPENKSETSPQPGVKPRVLGGSVEVPLLDESGSIDSVAAPSSDPSPTPSPDPVTPAKKPAVKQPGLSNAGDLPGSPRSALPGARQGGRAKSSGTAEPPVIWPPVLRSLDFANPGLREAFLDPRNPLPQIPGVSGLADEKKSEESTLAAKVTPEVLARRVQERFWKENLQYFPTLRSVVRFGERSGYVVWSGKTEGNAAGSGRSSVSGFEGRLAAIGVPVVVDLNDSAQTGVSAQAIQKAKGGVGKLPVVEFILEGIGEAEVFVSIVRINSTFFPASERFLWSIPWSWHGRMNSAALADLVSDERGSGVSVFMGGQLVPPPPSRPVAATLGQSLIQESQEPVAQPPSAAAVPPRPAGQPPFGDAAGSAVGRPSFPGANPPGMPPSSISSPPPPADGVGATEADVLR